MTATIHVRASQSAISRAIGRVPSRLTTGGNITRRMLKDIGNAVLTRIREAFVVKMKGGTDEAGERWAPLAKSTVSRRIRKYRTRTERKRKGGPDQGYTKRQQERFWKHYRRGLIVSNDDPDIARRYAFGMMQKEGAQTLFDKYAHRVEILHDTGALLKSLTPNIGGIGGELRVFRIEPGSVTVGTSRPGASVHHHGQSGEEGRNIPQRRLWPHPDRWPVKWWQDITKIVRQAVVDMAAQLARNA